MDVFDFKKEAWRPPPELNDFGGEAAFQTTAPTVPSSTPKAEYVKPHVVATIPDDVLQAVFDVLDNLDLPPQKRAVDENPEGRGICTGVTQNRQRIYVQQRAAYRKATIKINKLIAPYKPAEFRDTSLQINQNFKGRDHVDRNNMGPSLILVLARGMQGGGFHCQGLHFAADGSLISFDGRDMHGTDEFTFDDTSADAVRYSLVWFPHSAFKALEPGEVHAIEAMHFQPEGVVTQAVHFEQADSPLQLLATLPNDHRNHWIKTNDSWIRMCCKPRRKMLTPGDCKNGPSDDILCSERVTYAVFANGDKQQITDNWRDPKIASKTLERQWRGAVVFKRLDTGDPSFMAARVCPKPQSTCHSSQSQPELLVAQTSKSNFPENFNFLHGFNGVQSSFNSKIYSELRSGGNGCSRYS